MCNQLTISLLLIWKIHNVIFTPTAGVFLAGLTLMKNSEQ